MSFFILLNIKVILKNVGIQTVLGTIGLNEQQKKTDTFLTKESHASLERH